MPAPYDPSAPKESVCLDINVDLLARAAEMDLSLSDILEQALAEAVAPRQNGRLDIDDFHAEMSRSMAGADPALLAAAIGLFGNDALAVKWLTTPARALGGRRPVDADVQEALDVLGRLEHGFGA
ncbi:putative toxin-antitoxin system antitoxin component (TIGR02293 family) [Pseudomonas sp. IAP-CY TE4608]